MKSSHHKLVQLHSGNWMSVVHVGYPGGYGGSQYEGIHKGMNSLCVCVCVCVYVCMCAFIYSVLVCVFSSVCDDGVCAEVIAHCQLMVREYG